MPAPAPHVAVLTFWDPWEAPHGGTLRTRAICEALARAGARVSCVFPRSAASEAGEHDGVVRVPVDHQTLGHRRWPPALQRVKRQLLPIPTALGARSEQLRRALDALAPVDLLVVSHLSATQYHEVLPGSGLWLDQSDLWSDFAAREAATRRGVSRVTARLQRQGLLRAEDRAVRRADVVTAAGWTDGERLAARTGATVRWLPTPVDPPRLPARDAGSRPAIGFLANFAYHPNRDALDVLVRSWLGPLEARGWEVVVAGLESEALDLPASIVRLGPVADLREFYGRVDATAAPVRLGGGMKVKVAESLLADRPVIATDFALDGFPPEVRRLAVAVDPTRPAVPSLEELRAATPSVPPTLRTRFSMAGCAETVAEALAALGSGRLQLADGSR